MAKSEVLVRMKADTQNYDANIAKARRQLDQFKKDNLSMSGILKQLNGNLLSAAASFASVTAAVGMLTAAFRNNIETAKGFEKSMSQLSSLTGMVGSDLEKLKEYAIDLGASTTLSASQVADAFKMIGSQQPQLLASGEELKSVTKNAITLAEAAGIELSDAAKTLSVSINQMGGDSANSERYINVLAAAAQKGAGDIVWLGEAITKSGTTAKAVGTGYEELVANLEQLAKAGYDASTAGTALRSIIMNLEKQSNQQYKPSVVGLTEAFKNLGEANLTLTEYQGIAGKLFAAQAKALADAAAEAKNMKEEITGTNIAEEQAKTNTDNLDGSLKSLASAWEGLNLHINSSNGLLKVSVDWLAEVIRVADKAVQKLNELKLFTPVADSIKGGIQNQKNQGKTPAKVESTYTETVDTKTGKVVQTSRNGQVLYTAPGYESDEGSGNGGSSKKTTKGKTTNTKTYAPGSLAEAQADVQKYTKLWQEAGATVRDSFITQLVAAEEKVRKLKEEMDWQKDLAMGKYSGEGDFRSSMKDATSVRFNTTLDDMVKDGKDKAKSGTMLLSDKAMTVVAKQIKDATKPQKKEEKSAVEVFGQMNSGINQIVGGIEGLGITIPEELSGILGGINSMLSILQGITILVQGIAAMQEIGTFLGILSNGGIVPHAAGGRFIGGNSYSGDNIYAGNAWVNSGELVLNKAQQGNLASQLTGGGLGNLHLETYLDGRAIRIVLNNDSQSRMKGRYVTSKNYRG